MRVCRRLMPDIAVLNLTLPPVQAKVDGDATASFSTPSFTVAPGSSFTFQFTITAPASLPSAQHLSAGFGRSPCACSGAFSFWCRRGEWSGS